jgi:hypothetical protein
MYRLEEEPLPAMRALLEWVGEINKSKPGPPLKLCATVD